MHLPWTQVENEAVELGEQLGRLLRIDPNAGIGLMVKLHRWALRRAPEGDFTGNLRDPRAAELVASGLGWAGDPLELWNALVRLEFAAGPAEGEGSRIRGLPRYEPTWRRNKRTTRGDPPRNNRGTRGDPPAADAESDADADAESDHDLDRRPGPSSSPQPPVENPPTEDVNSQGKGTGYDVEGNASSFLAYAKSLDEKAFGDPGPKVREWARDFFTKYQPHDQGAIREAFGSFVVWTSLERKKPGWGLWLVESIWLERFNTARAKRNPIQPRKP